MPQPMRQLQELEECVISPSLTRSTGIQGAWRTIGPLPKGTSHVTTAGQLTPGHEHLASTVVRQTVADVTDALQPQNGAARVVVATPARQQHEIGAMLVAVSSALEGWHVTYLGGDLPAADIARAAEQTAARVIALSITHPPDDPLLGAELEQLRRLATKSTPILIGGQAAPSYRHIIDTIGAVYIEDLNILRRTLHDLQPHQ